MSLSPEITQALGVLMFWTGVFFWAAVIASMGYFLCLAYEDWRRRKSYTRHLQQYAQDEHEADGHVLRNTAGDWGKP